MCSQFLCSSPSTRGWLFNAGDLSKRSGCSTFKGQLTLPLFNVQGDHVFIPDSCDPHYSVLGPQSTVLKISKSWPPEEVTLNAITLHSNPEKSQRPTPALFPYFLLISPFEKIVLSIWHGSLSSRYDSTFFIRRSPEYSGAKAGRFPTSAFQFLIPDSWFPWELIFEITQ